MSQKPPGPPPAICLEEPIIRGWLEHVHDRIDLSPGDGDWQSRPLTGTVKPAVFRRVRVAAHRPTAPAERW